ncbi:MAG TPA: hypothetical protein ENI61_00485 [Ignavibacteria bacterium]|nr:hypothetical protein [Ignavibacteria bacterium]
MVELSDWKAGSDPTPLDIEMAKLTALAISMQDCMKRHNKRPDGADTNEPWPITICKTVVETIEGEKSDDLQMDVMSKYVEIYGMNMILETFGMNSKKIYEMVK